MTAHKATTRSWIRSHISVFFLVIRTANLVPFGVLQEVLDRRELGPGEGPIGWKTPFLGADPQRLLEARIGDNVLLGLGNRGCDREVCGSCPGRLPPRRLCP